MPQLPISLSMYFSIQLPAEPCLISTNLHSQITSLTNHNHRARPLAPSSQVSSPQELHGNKSGSTKIPQTFFCLSTSGQMGVGCPSKTPLHCQLRRDKAPSHVNVADKTLAIREFPSF